MKFSIVEDAIRECRKHLNVTGASGTETETRLAAYLLVLISAQFEVRIEAILEAYARRITDSQVRRFVVKMIGEKLRAPAISSISGVLNTFDSGWGDTFRDTAGGQAIAAYDSIINNRHAFVHEARVNVTLNDLESYFHNSANIFSALVSTLGLLAKEVQHLH